MISSFSAPVSSRLPWLCSVANPKDLLVRKAKGPTPQVSHRSQLSCDIALADVARAIKKHLAVDGGRYPGR